MSDFLQNVKEGKVEMEYKKEGKEVRRKLVIEFSWYNFYSTANEATVSYMKRYVEIDRNKRVEFTFGQKE